MSRYIELEIQSLLKETGDAAIAADRLIQAIEKDPEQLTDSGAIEALSRFLLNAGFTATLRDFVLRHIEDETFPTPWAYFVEALAQMSADQNIEISDEGLRAFEKGVRELGLQKVLGRSKSGERILPELRHWRSDLRYRTHKEYTENKKILLDQLVTLRIQRLVEKEKELLKKLAKLYPGDGDVHKETLEHRQRNALEILSRRKPSFRHQTLQNFDDINEEEKPSYDALMSSLVESAQSHPEMSYELAVLAWVLEAYDIGLQVLDFAPDDEQKLWFRLDLLLKNHRYLELLTELSQVEMKLAADPETFFATAYLRAQAYWGLGQKDTAIEVMESLLATRPHYRAGESLLNSWRGPQT